MTDRRRPDHRGAQGLLHQRAFRRAARGARGRRHRPHACTATRSTASPASPRRGKTSLIKTLAGAIRPPMRVVGGSVNFNFGGKTIDVYGNPAAMKAVRWRHLSYIMQGSMNVLNPVRRVKHSFRDFAARHMGLDADAFRARVEAHLETLQLEPRRAARPSRTSSRAACASASRSRSRPSASPSSSSPTSRPPRSTCSCSRTCWPDQGGAVAHRLLGRLRHPRHVGACRDRRPPRHHVCRAAGRGGADAGDLFDKPQHPYTAHLIGSLPRIGDVRQRKSLPGRPPNLADPPPRLPLPSALPARHRPLHQGSAGDAAERDRRPRRLLPCRGGVARMSGDLLELDHVTKLFPIGGLLLAPEDEGGQRRELHAQQPTSPRSSPSSAKAAAANRPSPR